MKSLNQKIKSSQGFIALISVIIISLLLITLTATLSLTGFLARFNSLDYEFKYKSEALAEACVEQALLKLAVNPAYSGNENLTLSGSSCQVSGIILTGLEYTITTQASVNGASTSLTVVAESGDFSVVSYRQTAD